MLQDKPIPNQEKPAVEHEPVNPTVAPHGIPGFHHKKAVDGAELAGMELDENTNADRVDTGTGDQPGNTGGSRFATPSEEDA